MKVTYFFRKPAPHFHSIEELFVNIINNLPKEIEAKKVYSKYHTGIVGRIKNIFEAKKQQSEINHITGDINYISLLMSKQKTILTIHDIAPAISGGFVKRNIIKYFWFKIPVKRVKYVTVISEFTKKQVIKYLKIPENKIHIIPNCISPKLKYSPKSELSKKPVLLQIGTKTNKNIPNLIKAIKDIDCKLIIIGKLRSEQSVLLKEYRIDYKNYSNLSYAEIIEHYKNCDIVTFASTYEGFGVPIIEANAIGRLIITSNISPMREVADNSAILVNPYEIDEIKNAILKLINSKEFRNELIVKGLENVKKYSAQNIAKQYAQLYKKM